LPSQSDAPKGFDELWLVEAYGISQALIEAGHVSADQWAKTLNAALQRKLYDEGLPDNAETYSLAIIEAFGEVFAENGIITLEELEQRSEAWRAAYKRTPHGRPVELE
jgi:hypothetical protein